MKEYEMTVLYHPDLEMNIDPALDKVKEEIEKAGGEIEKISNEGKRKLAYDIKKNEFAVFYYYEVKLPAEGPKELSDVFNISNEVIRYMIVKKDPRREKALKEKEARAEEKDKEVEE